MGPELPSSPDRFPGGAYRYHDQYTLVELKMAPTFPDRSQGRLIDPGSPNPVYEKDWSENDYRAHRAWQEQQVRLQREKQHMPEEVETVIPEPTEESDIFPELGVARKIGRLMEKAPPEMRAFLVAWLQARYGHEP